MKKFVVLAVLLCGAFSAQAQALNEVKINILNTIMMASFEMGYERFIDHNQSVGADLYINDRFSYYKESKSKDQKFKATSIGVNYNYYFGGANGANGSGYVVTPFLKYRFGSFEENTFDELEQVYTQKTDIDSFIVGLGVGYKWTMGDSFAIQPFANIARNFSDEVQDRFSAIEFNAGINIGYRF
jgi:opacity protein-like surface antigen